MKKGLWTFLDHFAFHFLFSSEIRDFSLTLVTVASFKS